jgi:hypothetical protein
MNDHQILLSAMLSLSLRKHPTFGGNGEPALQNCMDWKSWSTREAVV